MDENNKAETSNTVQIRKPKRVIHCSDGIYEEYSSDEENEENIKEDLKNMSIFRRIGHSIVFGLDYLGEGLANILNITTPKYAYEIEQFKRMEEERRKEEQHERDTSWAVKQDVEAAPNVITEGPQKNESPIQN